MNSPVTGEFLPAQRASNAENASIWWRHQVTDNMDCLVQDCSISSALKYHFASFQLRQYMYFQWLLPIMMFNIFYTSGRRLPSVWFVYISWTQIYPLWLQVTPYCIIALFHRWFRYWFTVCLAPRICLNERWGELDTVFAANITKIKNNKKTKF